MVVTMTSSGRLRSLLGFIRQGLLGDFKMVAQISCRLFPITVDYVCTDFLRSIYGFYDVINF